jgi:hypothetical protein
MNTLVDRHLKEGSVMIISRSNNNSSNYDFVMLSSMEKCALGMAGTRVKKEKST